MTPRQKQMGLLVVLLGVIVGLVTWIALRGEDPAEIAEPDPTPAESPEETPDPTPDPEPDEPEPDEIDPETIGFELIVSGLDQLTDATAPAGDDRLFVVERRGVIRIVENGDVHDEPFLDISDLVSTHGLEQGLLGLAFHPEYAGNGRFFVHYSAAADGRTVLAEYRVSDDPDRADPESQRVVFTADQPAGNHNGGMILFGPDGYLWMALGDGGGGGDRFGHGQNTDSLLGTLLRIDADQADGDRGYAIPEDNPFADGQGGEPEIWAYGLRNPWRFDIDEQAGLLYIADVGQNAWEWVNVVPVDEPGLNHGWPITEGSHCFDPPQDCPTDGLVMPALEYENTGADCAIIGGFVSAGRYFYSDYCGGWVRSFLYDGETGQATDVVEHAERGELGQVFAFGRDCHGRLYVLNGDGEIYRVVAGD
jgi:glucose/arabinose dehydrogenase